MKEESSKLYKKVMYNNEKKLNLCLDKYFINLIVLKINIFFYFQAINHKDLYMKIKKM